MTIVPRWEWRTFGEDFGDAERTLAALDPGRVDESADVYVLSRRSDASVKVRDGLLDVKHLLEVADDRLERWVPALKTPFPVGARDVAATLEALGVSGTGLPRDVATIGQLVGSAGPPADDLRVLEVRKRRRRFVVAGCMAEISEFRTPERSARTVAVEAEDGALVREVVRRLGLSGRPVVCVARGLKALTGFAATRYAVIDVGTNSVKFHIGERSADGAWRPVLDRAAVTRLGEGLDATGRLSRAAVDRTVAAIVRMAGEARQAGAEEVTAVGTAALRGAPNASEVLDAVDALCGIRVEVLPATEETRLAYLAAKAGLELPPGPTVVFDTGGGSSQFTFGTGTAVDESFSLDVGAARFTERYGLDRPVARGDLEIAGAAIAADLRPLRDRSAPATVVGMGGAVTNLTAVKLRLSTYEPDTVHASVLDLAEIERQIEVYRTRDAAGRREVIGLQPARAEVILAGACIVRAVLTLLGRDALVVSDRGLRHGLLVERCSAPPPPVTAVPVS